MSEHRFVPLRKPGPKGDRSNSTLENPGEGTLVIAFCALRRTPAGVGHSWFDFKLGRSDKEHSCFSDLSH